MIKTFVILEDAREFTAFNKTYATYFPSNPPARTTLEARLMIDIKIEIEATKPTGFEDSQVRTLSENAKTLKFDQSGFEES